MKYKNIQFGNMREAKLPQLPAVNVLELDSNWSKTYCTDTVLSTVYPRQQLNKLWSRLYVALVRTLYSNTPQLDNPATGSLANRTFSSEAVSEAPALGHRCHSLN